MVVGRGQVRAKAPPEFEIWYFPIKFLAKKAVFLVSSGKMKFCHFWPPLKKYFWLCLEESPIDPPLEKILPTPMVASANKTAVVITIFVNFLNKFSLMFAIL